MATLIALLRGINVAGKSVKMDSVRASFEAVGCSDVRTYVQSGNVLFTARAASPTLGRKLEAQLQHDAGAKIPVLLKTTSDLGQIIRINPFLQERGVDVSKLHVTFLADNPTKLALKALAAIDANGDEYHHSGTEIYVHCPNGYGRTKLSNTAIEKALAVVATTRNWNTVNKLYDMASDSK